MHTFTESFGCAKTAEKTRNVKWGRCPAINRKESRFTVEKSLTAPYKKKEMILRKIVQLMSSVVIGSTQCHLKFPPNWVEWKLEGIETMRNGFFLVWSMYMRKLVVYFIENIMKHLRVFSKWTKNLFSFLNVVRKIWFSPTWFHQNEML